MQAKELENYTHNHVFHVSSQKAEQGTRWVMWISAAMMVIEIVFGWLFNSMALLADGWHMSSHTVAIGLSALAYVYARRYANDSRFAFGTWKIEVLGGFTSAILLLCVAFVMFMSSFERIYDPTPIQYEQAIWIAALGLCVNLLCAYILARSGADHHGHDHHGHDHHGHDHHGHGHHGHGHHGHGHSADSKDLNLRSAYVHILADAATSVLAIVALGLGWAFGFNWLDPIMGILGAILIAVWSKKLIVDCGLILLDCEPEEVKSQQIKRALNAMSSDKELHVVDLHVWRVGKSAFTCAISIVTPQHHLTPQAIKSMLNELGEVVHSTVEVHHI